MLSDVAREFAGIKFEKMDGVLGVLLIGSTSLGYVDNLADIDLEIVLLKVCVIKQEEHVVHRNIMG